TSIHTSASGHSTPIPAASRIGPLLVTGINHGVDPAKPDHPGSLDAQCALMFSRIREVVAAGGATVDQIAKVNISVPDLAMRDVLNRHWVAMFPDAAARPARQTTEMALERGKLVQCDVLAWVGD
ncbi:MAG: RidA family protein, partial [Hyphomicrobiaceae bacterium]